MKRFLLYTLLCVAIVTLPSCKMELEPYSDPTNRVAFVYDRDRDADSLFNFSFAYYSANVTEGIVELDITAIGFLSDRPRTVSISQTNSGTYAAKPGVHYQMASEFVIPANATGVKIPVTVLRDPSLVLAEYTLVLSLVANNDFQLGNPARITKKIVISDILTKPKEWSSTADWYIGSWGREKYKVMIEAAVPYDVIIDGEWLGVTVPDYPRFMAWKTIFEAKLAEINEALGSNGPLKEDNGTIVVFSRS